MTLTVDDALSRLHHDSVSEARRWGMSDEQANLCRDVILERITQLESEIANMHAHRREVIAPLTFGGDNCMCRQRPVGGCDLIGCPHREGGNWSAP